MSVIWRAAAIADVVRIVTYISTNNPIAARQIGQELFVAGDSLAAFPRRGRIGRIRGTRELTTTRPYVIVYEVDDTDNVDILRVWHAAQKRAS